MKIYCSKYDLSVGFYNGRKRLVRYFPSGMRYSFYEELYIRTHDKKHYTCNFIFRGKDCEGKDCEEILLQDDLVGGE